MFFSHEAFIFLQINDSTKYFMGATFQLNNYIYLCLIYQQLSRVYRTVDP